MHDKTRVAVVNAWRNDWLNETFWRHCGWMLTASLWATGDLQTPLKPQGQVWNQRFYLSVISIANSNWSRVDVRGPVDRDCWVPLFDQKGAAQVFTRKTDLDTQHGPTNGATWGQSQSCSFARLLKHLRLTLHNTAQRSHLCVFPPSSLSNIHRIPSLPVLHVDMEQTPFKAKQGI